MAVLRSGRKFRQEDESSSSKGDNSTNDKKTASRLRVFISIFADGNFFKHWALYVEYEKPRHERSFICHVTGSAGRFSYETTPRYAREYDIIYDLHLLGTISEAEMDRLRDICGTVPPQNDTHGWNCQDWVSDAFGALVLQGVLTPADGVDEAQIRGRMDGY